MSKIEVAYGKGHVSLDADPGVAEWTSIRPTFEAAHPDPEAGFRAAAADPVGAKPLARAFDGPRW